MLTKLDLFIEEEKKNQVKKSIRLNKLSRISSMMRKNSISYIAFTHKDIGEVILRLASYDLEIRRPNGSAFPEDKEDIILDYLLTPEIEFADK